MYGEVTELDPTAPAAVFPEVEDPELVNMMPCALEWFEIS